MARISLPTNEPAARGSQNQPRTLLIVNADLFGIHPAINQAVIHAHEIGIVTSCSLTPLGGEPAFDQAAEMALGMPSLDVGLHFCLVGLPGQPKNYAEFLPRYLSKKYPETPIEAMVHRQIDLLERVGIKPSHIDSNQNLHAIPDIMRAVCRAAVDRGIRSVRVPIDKPLPGTPISRVLAAKGITEYAKRSKVIVEEYGLWHADSLIGMSDPGHLTEGRLMELLSHLDHGVTELICNPGAHNSRIESALKLGYGWEAERAALISERVSYKLSAMNIGLTNFRIQAEEAAAREAKKASAKAG